MSQESKSGGETFSRLGMIILPHALKDVKELKSAEDINDRYRMMFAKTIGRFRSMAPRVKTLKKDSGTIHFTIDCGQRFKGDPLYTMCMMAEIYQYLLQDLCDVRMFYAEMRAKIQAEIHDSDVVEDQHLDVEGLHVMDDGSVVHSFSTYGELKPLKS